MTQKKSGKEMECVKKCIKKNNTCAEKKCRHWIDFPKDLNCSLISIQNNNFKGMTLKEVSDRLGISIESVRKIEKKAFIKIKERI